MRKQFTIFLILIFVLGLVPVNFSTAITQNQIDAEVQIVCTDGSDNWFSGSGTIIDPKGIILTNKHVIEGAYMDTCFIGFIESISQEPNFGSEGNYNLAEVKYYTSADDMDAAILYFDNPTNKTYPYINIWDSNSDNLQFGDKLEVIGFPGVGGSTITYTSGDFSGFGSNSDGTHNYLKAAVSIDHGNSGGATYDQNGNFIGIPTFVIQDINSMSYILSINSIKKWMSNILGSDYQSKITEKEPNIKEPISSIQSDITPPSISNVSINKIIGLDCDVNTGVYDLVDWKNTIPYNDDDSIDRFFLEKQCDSTKFHSTINQYQARKFSIVISLEKFKDDLYIYSGKDVNTIPYKYSGSRFVDSTYLSNPANGANYLQIVHTAPVQDPGVYYVIIQAVDEFNNYSERIIFQYDYQPKSTDDSLNPDIFKIYSDQLKQYLYYVVESGDFRDLIIPQNNFYLEWDYSNGNSANNIQYEIKLKEKLESGDFDEETESAGFECRKSYGNTFCNYMLLVNTSSRKNTKFNYLKEKMKYYLFVKSSYGNTEGAVNPLSITYNPLSNLPKSTVIPDAKADYDLNFASNLKGLILLQVENNGEAYYVNPEDVNRYFLGRPADSFQVMRNLGLGATHQFISSHTIFPSNVLGKILLDVEQNGEAYYIYPKDKKAYYLGRPADAFKIMRELGLGITDDNLNKIPLGSL